MMAIMKSRLKAVVAATHARHTVSPGHDLARPFRFNKWVIATDGWGLVALKIAGEYPRIAGKRVKGMRSVMKPKLLGPLFPILPLRKFCAKGKLGMICGHPYDLRILRDLLTVVDAEEYQLFSDSGAHCLHIGGDGWRIALMQRINEPGFKKVFDSLSNPPS
jgi:hypothetical protein